MPRVRRTRHGLTYQYFSCDYTSLTCQRGYHYYNWFLFEALADDRKTTLSHRYCIVEIGRRGTRYETCLDFDSGEVQDTTNSMRNLTITDDMPENCLDVMLKECAVRWIPA